MSSEGTSNGQELEEVEEFTDERLANEVEKRLYIEDNRKDPFTHLPEPAIENILQYFTGKELLNLMEVSNGWKSYIESSRYLMNRAMDQVVVRFPHFVYRYEPLDRNYKHMAAYFSHATIQIIRKESQLIHIYANSLETLHIKCNCNNYKCSMDFPGVNFTKLKKLYITCQSFDDDDWDCEHPCILKFLSLCFFPELAQLCIDIEWNESFMAQILPKCPKLKTFYMKYPNASGHNIEASKVRETFLKLKYLGMWGYNLSLIELFGDSLTELCCIYGMLKSDLQHLLTRILQLKRLTIDSIGSSNWNFTGYPRHNNLEVLTCNRHPDSTNLHEILLSLPSLKILICVRLKISRVTVEFIASNMKNLEKLICSEILDEALEFHRELRSDQGGNDFINTTFQIEIKRADELANSYKKKFDLGFVKC